MKAVLISIQPKWCELIASGKKTVEVRKTLPKLETPFKAYIYCTKKKKEDEYGRSLIFYKDVNGICEENGEIFSPLETGKVIGEFVCNRISGGSGEYVIYHTEGTCLTPTEIADYIGDKYAYYWHISDLKIYDKPRELSEFKQVKKIRGYHKKDEPKTEGINIQRLLHSNRAEVKYLTRPPQSWCYVESEDA